MKTPEVPLRGFCFVGRLTTISFLADISIAHNTARIKYSRLLSGLCAARKKCRVEYEKPRCWNTGAFRVLNEQPHLFLPIVIIAQMGGLGYTLFAHCDIIPMLSHPIRQRKGDGLHEHDNFVLGFCCGKCYQLLHLQMVRRKRQVTTSLNENPGGCVSGVFALCVA